MMNDDAGRHPRELLSACLDGELGPDERSRLAAHLGQCAACTELLDDLRTLAAGVAAEEPPPPPADLAARIGRRVGVLAGDARVIPVRRPVWRSPLALSAMAATLAGIMVTVVWFSARPPVLRQEASLDMPGPATPARPADHEADGAASPDIGKQKKGVAADAPAIRSSVPLPQAAQETMALMRENAARVEQPTAPPPPAGPPGAAGDEEVGAPAPGGPPVAEPPPARSLELLRSDYRAVLSEAGALTFRAGAYECVVPPGRAVDLGSEIRQIFALAAAEQSRPPAATGEERASVGARRDAPASEEQEPRRESQALQFARSAPPAILIFRDANETPLHRADLLSAQEEGVASSAAPLAARLDRLIREHYLALMEQGCGPLPPELQQGE